MTDWTPKPGDVVAVRSTMNFVPSETSNATPTAHISPGLYWPGQPLVSVGVAPADIAPWMSRERQEAYEALRDTAEAAETALREFADVRPVDRFFALTIADALARRLAEVKECP